ncbi:Btb/poz domain-containing protein [Pandoravirus kuranda]|uniref:Btb/poz domain-containing protein n=1 Tax=Pandoravirus kuranda TaxID=3019033 RepID=A0AA95J816_9VIRU|nr:Btb/poz domain-containing protein [Pandoravirus kuranda]
MENEQTGPMQDGHGGSAETIVRLNVGGKTMLVARTTLVKDAHSMLGRMFAGDTASPMPGTLLRDGSYFIDCDPHCFAVILDHLRHGTIVVDPRLVGRVRCAADALGVSTLVDACDAQMASDSSRAPTTLTERSGECCPKCGEILADDEEKRRMSNLMNCFLDLEKHAFAIGWWYKAQYRWCRARAYHECPTPRRFVRDYWFETTVLVAVGLYAARSMLAMLSSRNDK